VVATAGPTLVRISARPAAPAILASTPLGDATALADSGNDDLTVAGDTLAVSSFRTSRVYFARRGS